MAQSEFQRLVSEFLSRNPVDGERRIADQFGVSLPTVQRWARGVNAPVPKIRSIVEDWLRSKE